MSGGGEAVASPGTVLDLNALLPGSETSESVVVGCRSGVDVALWTIAGGSHVPVLANPTWGDVVYGFLKKQRKP